MSHNHPLWAQQDVEAAKKVLDRLDPSAEGRVAKAKSPKEPLDFPVFLDYEDDVLAAVTEAGEADLTAAMSIAGKQEREAATDAAKAKVQEALADRFEGREKEVSAAFRSLTKSVVRRRIVTDKVRIDGRGL